MEQTKTVSLFLPSYKEMIQEAGKQLNLRKDLLMKRALYIGLPLSLWLVSVFIVVGALQSGDLVIAKGSVWVFPAIIFATTWTLFAFLWTIVRGLILSIEKLIWIDSYFDKKNLNPTASWQIAKKLFWPYLKFRLHLFLRYYFLPFLLYILFLILGGSFLNLGPWIIFLAMAGIFAVALYLGLYVRIKLRFASFIFLDEYGNPNFSHKNILLQMDKLNEIRKSDIFKQALVVNLGADSVNIIAAGLADKLQKGAELFGKVGTLAGVGLLPLVQSMAGQITDFGRIAALYLLYRFVRQELYKEPQHINEYLYNLS